MSTEAISNLTEQQFEPVLEMDVSPKKEEIQVIDAALAAIKENIPPSAPTTPERPKREPFTFSPSIKASPSAPKGIHPYHTVDGLARVSKRQVRGLRGKAIHSMIAPGSAQKQAGKLTSPSIAKYISKCSKHLALGKPGRPPPLERDGLRYIVPAPDKVLIINPRKRTRREFGVHRQPNGINKRFYPARGDGIFVASKNSPSKPNPRDLLSIRDILRSRIGTRRDLGAVFEAAFLKATPPPPLTVTCKIT